MRAWGREYTVESGWNYYLVDATSGTVAGMATQTPPDYNRDYRLLKKLYRSAPSGCLWATERTQTGVLP